jgi:ribosome maturation factor RimP
MGQEPIFYLMWDIMSQNLALEAIIAPTVAGLGYEFVKLEYIGGSGKYSTLRIYINKPGGVALNDCEKVSRQVSSVLDVEAELLRGAYTLEVSSPGVK